MAIIHSTAFYRREEVYQLSEIALVEIHRNTQNRKTEYKIFFNIETTLLSSSVMGRLLWSFGLSKLLFPFPPFPCAIVCGAQWPGAV